MGNQGLEIKNIFNTITMGVLCMCFWIAPLCPISSASTEKISDETPQVELYQDDKGEWKIKYLNAERTTDTQAPSVDQKLIDTKANTTEVELYQDENGEWKVRYNTTQAQAQEPVSAEPSTETTEKFDSSEDDVLASKDMLNEEPAEEFDAAAEEPEPAFDVVDDDQDDHFKETSNKITSESVGDAVIALDEKSVHAKNVKAVPLKTTASQSFLKENPSVYENYDEEYNRNPNRQWELGLDFTSYKYKQDEFVDNLGRSIAKTNEGNLAGIHLGYEHVLSEHGPYHSLADIIKNIDDVSRYKITLDYHTGQTEYSDNIGFPKEDFTQHIVEAKAVAGYDFMLKGNTRLTPFMGFGYRYVNDSSGTVLDIPDSLEDFTDSATYSAPWDNSLFIIKGEYSTQLHSLYLPVGLMTNSDISDDLSVGLNLEFDYVFLGIIKNSFNDLGELYFEDNGTRTQKLKDLTNRLKGGIGLKGSTRITKKQKEFDFYIEPYIRHWQIFRNEKQYEFKISDGQDRELVHTADKSPYKHIEPDSNTTEYGIQVGLVF